MRIRRVVAVCVLSAMFADSKGYADTAARQQVPWWKQQKIIFMWGKWPYVREDKSQDYYYADLPRHLFRNVAQIGATVFADCVAGTHWVQEDGGWVPSIERARRHAHYAHEFGLKYFNTLVRGPNSSLDSAGQKTPGARRAIWEDGTTYRWCPLDSAVYTKWIVEPHLQLLHEGLLDGIHIGWEASGEAASGGIDGFCYCDDCFSKFLESRQVDSSQPDLLEKAQRFPWIKRKNLLGAYEESFQKRRVAMFTGIREKLQAIKPDLLFSSYGTGLDKSRWEFIRAMHTPEAPFIFLDHARDYGNDDRQTWWMSSNTQLKKLGYLYVPGGWTNALFGAQASQVDAARWIYETAVNEDGVWLWFERELDDEIFRAYAAADRDIKTAVRVVGDYLLRGERDYQFVTLVEWTGRPELEQAAIAYTYHHGQEHLTQITNVDTEWPLRTRIRFPRLAEGKRWTVRDPIGDLYYTLDGKSAVWTTGQLHAGVVVAMKPRSDLFLLVSPAKELAQPPQINSSQMIYSREFSALPDHAAAAVQAGPIKTMIDLYMMGNSIYGEKLKSLLSTSDKVTDLPNAGWHFKMDQENIGPSEGWFLPSSPLDDWTTMDIAARWKADIGPGWYRADLDLPAPASGKRVYLYFGAVDEELVLWINGKYAGDYKHPRGPDYGWNKPFAIDVTDKLTPAPGAVRAGNTSRHHLAMRVYNGLGAGGVWKPVSVLVGQAVPGTTNRDDVQSGAGGLPSDLVYTASEPMGFGGNGEGGFTIGNAIRTVDGDSGDQLRVRQLLGHLWSPRYSPDGRKIAFVHDAGGRGQIWVMNADGTDAINLSNNDFCDRVPVWSPDGNRIAFLSDQGGDWDIYVMRSDGSGQGLLAGNPGLDRAPVWSPDGKRIAWESHTSGIPNIWIGNADNTNSRPLIVPDKPLRIQQVVSKGQQFHRFDLGNPFPDNTFYLTDPEWSPDGKDIVAVINGQDGSRGVIIDADGSTMLKLPFYNSSQYVWSPDGTKLAGTFRAPNETELSAIFVIHVDRSEELTGWAQRTLIEAFPLGPRLGGAGRAAFVTWYSHGSAQPRRVVKTFSSLSWSADSKTLAFSSDMHPSGAFYVYTLKTDGGEPERVRQSRSAWPQEMMWRP